MTRGGGRKRQPRSWKRGGAGGRGRRARACARLERRDRTRRPGAIQARARRLAGVVRACRAIAIRASRTLTTSAVRAAVALRAATRATGATTRRAETVAAIVAGCVCDANVRCGVPREARRPENATRKPVRASHEKLSTSLTRPESEESQRHECGSRTSPSEKMLRLNTRTRKKSIRVFAKHDNCHGVS